jgi:hypothetical protein
MKGISEKDKGLLLAIIFIVLLLVKSAIGLGIFLIFVGVYGFYEWRKKKK